MKSTQYKGAYETPIFIFLQISLDDSTGQERLLSTINLGHTGAHIKSYRYVVCPEYILCCGLIRAGIVYNVCG